MSTIKKCLNEWNATIEALGQGEQSILIRKYGTNLKDFILYPTISYTIKDGYLSSFKDKYQSFVEKNSMPLSDGDKKEIKYYAQIESIIEKPINRIGGLSDFHIQSNDHVRSYLKGEKAYVWILRVYKLKKPSMLKRTRGLRYANLLKELSLDGIEPVINDYDFDKIFQEIKSKK